jgi:diadenylate cyclase
LGITEETDSIALVVSEESGALSVCFKGEIAHDLEPEELKETVTRILQGGGLRKKTLETEEGKTHEKGR